MAEAVTMEQLTNQVALLTQQLNEQTHRLNQVNRTAFELTPDQIIRNFNEITPFSGENSFKLKSFLSAVEDVEALCGQNNAQLRQYCLKKIINSKIIGKARNVILEIPEDSRNWATVVNTLTLRFRPKRTIHQLLFQAKELKVFNLKDLFNKLSSIKSETSEICDFDNEESFTYESIDKELVQILKLKLTPIMQIQIDQSKTLFELDNIFCQSEIYLSDEVIKNEYRLNKNNKIGKINQFVVEKNKKQNPNFQRKNSSYNNYRSTYNSPNTFNNPNTTRPNFFNNNYHNNRTSGQFKRQNFSNNNRSGQFRNFNNRTEQPMEIENINKQNDADQEVNFTN